MFVAPRVTKDGKTTLFYLCTSRHKTGTKICANKFALPYYEITQAVIDQLSSDLLTTENMVKLLTDDLLAPEDAQTEQGALAASLKTLDRELANLNAVAAAGGADVASLVEALKTKQRQRDVVAARLEHLEGLEKAREGFDLDSWLPQEGQVLLVDLEEMLHADPGTSRGILRGLLVSPIWVHPETDADGKLLGWSWGGIGTLGKVLAGRVPIPMAEISPADANRADFASNRPLNLWERGG